MPTALFFSRVRDPQLLRILEFYTEDILMLERAGYSVTVATTLRTALRANADLCYAWWWATALPVAVLYRALRRPVILTGACSSIDPGARRTRQRAKEAFRSGLSWISVRASTGIVVISDFEADIMSSYRPRRMARLYPAVDTTFFGTRSKSPCPTVVTVGQLNANSIRRKGIDIAIRSMEIVRKEVPNAELLVIGRMTDDGRQYLDQLGDQADMTGISFLGEVTREDKRDRVASAWAYAQPSRVEGFGLAVAEAMASGTVPVLSVAGALPEVGGSAGIYVRRRDHVNVAEALIDLLQDRPERERRQSACRERAVQMFDREQRQVRAAQLLAQWSGIAPLSSARDLVI